MGFYDNLIPSVVTRTIQQVRGAIKKSNEEKERKQKLRESEDAKMGGPWSGWELKPLSVRNTETLDKFGKSLRESESSEDSLDLRKKNEEKIVDGFAKPSTVKWGVSSFNNANQFKKVSSQNSNANVNPVSAMTTANTATAKNLPVIGMFDFTKYGSNSALGKMAV